jgi:hypothetical protein
MDNRLKMVQAVVAAEAAVVMHRAVMVLEMAG